MVGLIKTLPGMYEKHTAVNTIFFFLMHQLFDLEINNSRFVAEYINDFNYIIQLSSAKIDIVNFTIFIVWIIGDCCGYY